MGERRLSVMFTHGPRDGEVYDCYELTEPPQQLPCRSRGAKREILYSLFSYDAVIGVAVYLFAGYCN